MIPWIWEIKMCFYLIYFIMNKLFFFCNYSTSPLHLSTSLESFPSLHVAFPTSPHTLHPHPTSLDVNLTGKIAWYKLQRFGWRHFRWRKISQDRRHKDYLDKSKIGSTRNPERNSHQISSNAKSSFIENKNQYL